jgi:alpha-tubulin suppressor-like RCC1 family protein
MWGANDRGQLGTGDRMSWCIPRKVDVLIGMRRRDVDGGRRDLDGGRRDVDGGRRDVDGGRREATAVDGGRVASISCGSGYTMCVWETAEGSTQVYGWGRNDGGQLGSNQLLEIALWIRSMPLKTGNIYVYIYIYIYIWH